MDAIEDAGAPSEVAHSGKLFAVQAGALAVLALEILVIAVINADTNIDTGNPIAPWIYLVATVPFVFAEMVGLATGLVALAYSPLRRTGLVVLARTLALGLAWFVLVLGFSI